MVAVADQAPFLEGERRVVDEGRLDRGADLGAELESGLELGEPPRPSGGEPGLDLGQERQRPGQGGEVSGRGAAGSDPGGEALEVIRAIERGPEVAPQAGVADQFGDGVVAVDDRRKRGQRRGQPVAQHPRPHRRAGPVDRLEQRAFAAILAEGPGQLQAPPGHLVEPEDVLAVIGGQPGDVGDGRLLGVAEVGDERPGGLDLGAVVVDPEAGQGGRAELVVEDLMGLLEDEVPRRPARHDGRVPVAEAADPGGVEAGLRDQDLGGVEPGDLVEQLGPAHAGQGEPPGRELDPGQAELAANLDHGGQVIRGAGVEEGILGQGARRDHADDVTLDDPLGEAGVFDLLADRRADAGLHQLGEVGFERGVGEAGHLGGVRPLVLVAGRHGEAEEFGGPLGVVAEHLVEVAHAEEEQGAGIAGLELAILLHHRGRGEVAAHDGRTGAA